MTYRHDVPEQSNLVRGVSGDLVAMRENFRQLAPVISGILTSGTAPDADLVGLAFRDGTVTETDVFRLFVAGGTQLHLQRFNLGQWRTLMAFDVVSGADIQAANPVSGQTPVSGYHLTTKAYVDGRVLDNLADVVAPSPVSGEGLVFNGTNWVPGPVASVLTGLGDVAISGPVSGEALVYNGSQWVNDSVASTLSGLSDVDVTGAVDGNTLVYSGGIWRDGTLVTDHGALTGLGDDDHAQYSLADGTRPFTGPVSGVTPSQPAHLATKSYVDNLSGLTISGAVTLSGLTDVDDAVDLGADGDVLTLSGGIWYALPPAGGADILAVQIFS